MNFFIKLISPDSGLSSKRFIAIGSFIIAIVFGITSIFLPIEMGIIYSFVGLAGGGAVATGLEHGNKKH